MIQIPFSQSALVVMDFQNGILERYSQKAEELLPKVSRAIAVARQVGIEVFYVRVAFRPNYPEVSMNNAFFSAVVGNGDRFNEESSSTQIHSSIKPQVGEIVITKRRVSAFTGSDLDVLLRAKNIKKLILAGVSTSGVVLSTLRAAYDLDFSLVVLKDACLDPDEEVHKVLTEKVFIRQAEVVNVDEWISTVEKK